MEHVARRPPGGRVEVAAGGKSGVVDAHQRRGEGLRVARFRRHGGERADDVPVRRAVESHPFPLAFDHHPGRDRLHPAGRQPRQHLLPQHGADLVAVEPVEDAASLLGVDEVVVEIAWRGDGRGDRRRGDLVKHHPAHRHLGVQRLDEVPGDGLALAILIRREVQLVGVLDERLELVDLLPAVWADDVERLEIVLGVDAEPRPRLTLVLRRHVGGVARQVADVTDRRLDDVPRTEVPADRLRFGRGLDDHQLGARGPSFCRHLLRLPSCRHPTCRRRGRYRTAATKR